ncbi:hypothetical protein A2160_04405 [Candidatus Beckwithbacteria bacterium RBG_13_42_9]|uniref:Uncharacterized protein n=1 Tax=Candidatus Beckwithbacteria bacterium RBG_13_42_9 TaxID=1797457 RepID=A0A1F5E6P3_9BACT|nr:MAG: hypothetical protein A2160_04405 [Candidatus Beckwithbacteria bacterium RBG_13_42_9]
MIIQVKEVSTFKLDPLSLAGTEVVPGVNYLLPEAVTLLQSALTTTIKVGQSKALTAWLQRYPADIMIVFEKGPTSESVNAILPTLRLIEV